LHAASADYVGSSSHPDDVSAAARDQQQQRSDNLAFMHADNAQQLFMQPKLEAGGSHGQQQHPVVAGSQAAAKRMQQLGQGLLDNAEPRLAQLRCWPSTMVGNMGSGFSQHQLVEEVQEALEVLAAAQQTVLQRSRS
jgi:hypothetical protein